jgi:hypothetical protein
MCLVVNILPSDRGVNKYSCDQMFCVLIYYYCVMLDAALGCSWMPTVLTNHYVHLAYS